jgi:peptidoglycan/xylan/chitin deacetylase (PgdA/CDA1 family)
MQGDVPARAVAITFDDGYADNYEYAFPILKKYNAPATIFVATGIVGTGNVLWHDRMFDAFRYATRKRAMLSNIDLPEVSLETPEAQRKSIWQIRLKARKMHGDALQVFMDELERALKPTCTAREKQRMLTWDQIQTMNRGGIDFGSHSVTHPILSELPYPVLMKELNESKRELCDRLQTDVVSFAYPNGQPADYSREVQTALKENGYRYAVTTSEGFNQAFPEPFALKRCRPWQNDIPLFRMAFFFERHGLRGESQAPVAMTSI